MDSNGFFFSKCDFENHSDSSVLNSNENTSIIDETILIKLYSFKNITAYKIL
jgi:hypothetical protein